MKKLFLLAFALSFSLIGCSNQKTYKVYVNNSEALLAHNAYESDNIVFCDALEICPNLGWDPEYSPDKTVMFATKNNYIAIVQVGQIIMTISNVSTQESNSYTLETCPRQTSYGIDVPLKSFSEALGYSVNQTSDSIYLTNK